MELVKGHESITLSEDVVQNCWKFSQECSSNQQPYEFGQKDSASRLEVEIARDNMIGKLGELAVQSMFSRYGIHVDLDFTIYPRGGWDRCDIEHRGWMIDVKCTRRGKYFLIEWSKLQFRSDAGELPHYFLMTRIGEGDDVGLDGPSSPIMHVDLIGYVDVRKLVAENSEVRVIGVGERIPGTDIPITAKSFCIPFDDEKNLKCDWAEFVRRLDTESPFELKGYRVCQSPVTRVSKEEFDNLREKMLVPEARYSLLVSGRYTENLQEEYLTDLVKSGIKLFVFGTGREQEKYKNFLALKDRASFSFYTSQGDIPDLKITDGSRDINQKKLLKQLADGAPLFNLEQYEVEHASAGDDVVVKASAGTGKTAVMVDRIMFLLATDANLVPGDIGMLTFTNNAADSMLDKLQKRLMGMYQRTKSLRWFELLEQLSDMRISTLDSFFHDLLSTEGGELGYGSTARLRSFTYEKKQLIRNVINELFVEIAKYDGKTSKNKDLLNINGAPIYELVDTAFKLWNTLYSRGYFGKDILNSDFGQATDNRSKRINRVLRKVIVEAEQRYQNLKRAKNAYDITDIKAGVHALSHQNISDLRRRPLKYLFIDEFQDTDNSQIKSLVWLKKAMKCRLFVVGDIKQSIYRFRGAEESAFSRLVDELSPDIPVSTFVLSKNYRTSADVIQPLNEMFARWADSKDRLLVWDADASPVISEPGGYSKIEHSFKEGYGGFPNLLMKILSKESESSKHICILTRTNKQTAEVKKWCDERNIMCHAKMDGGFYQSKSVLDFHAFLGCLLYPRETHRLWNILQTPYCTVVPDIQKILKFNGDETKVRSYLRSLLTDESWLNFEAEARYRAFFPMLEEMMVRLNPVGQYKSYLNSTEIDKDEQKYLLDSYQINLNKLMQIVYERFTGDYASLLTVYQFIDLMVQTNSDEDVLYPDVSEVSQRTNIEAMTVHKSKGLEFETVIIPYTQFDFSRNLIDREESTASVEVITAVEDGCLKVGWSRGRNQNDYFTENIEKELHAVRRDEARLAYVAATRAKRRLVVMLPAEPQENSWAEYLSDPKEGGC